MGFLTLKIAVQIGLYVNINVNIKGPTLYSFISQECVSVVSAFVSDTENMALIWRGFLTICTYVCTSYILGTISVKAKMFILCYLQFNYPLLLFGPRFMVLKGNIRLQQILRAKISYLNLGPQIPARFFLPDYVSPESPREVWKTKYFESMKDVFLLVTSLLK